MPHVTRPSADEINASIRYVSWAVLRRTSTPPADTAQALADWTSRMADDDVVVRGLYDTSVMRADGDLLVWTHGPTAEGLQAAVRGLRRDVLGRSVELAWSAMALHRPAEFNKQHVPVFLSGVRAQQWLVCYPFTRSYDWYLLPEEERRDMLVEHGQMARAYPKVYNSTLSAFALGDYEWMLSIEADELHEAVDLMRHLRAARARLHVRAELPFYTGRLVDAEEAADVLA
jgi:hydrogen peroxide-dependent heme synthase